MPCYQLAPQDMTDLIAYLKRLETETEPGITAKEITIATMIPTEGALAPSGSAMRSALNAYFQELNSSGGIHQRTVALRFIEMVSNREVTISNLQGAMETDEVFAIIGGVMAGVDKEAFGLAQSWKVPIIGLITLLPEEGDNRYVFYFSPGMKDQARALVNFAAAKPDAKKSKLLVVYPEGILAKESADAIETQAQKLNWNVERKSYAGAVAAKLVEQLKGEPANAVFFLGSADETAAFLKEAALVNWTPKVLLLSTSIRNAASVPKEFKDRVFIAFPTIPADVSASAAGEYRSLREKYKLPEERLASQLAALAAAKVFVAAANKVGPELNREKFVNTLETLNNFETGLTHEITFGPRRRIGARGAYVVTVDVEKGSLSTVTGWVEAN
jgi:ABC-type branched-subunit amino acid transport system substrate-binding protein